MSATEKLTSVSPISAMKNKKILLIFLSAVLIFVFALSVLSSKMKTVYYEIESSKVEKPFRIVFISDLHSCSYGENGVSEIVDEVRAQNPDVVLFGGDMFDSRRMPEDNAVALMKVLGSEFNCYYSTGNHEVRHGKLDYYKEIAASCGVKVLDGTHTKIAVSALSTEPDIYGFDDATAYGDFYDQLSHIEETAGNYHFENSFNVLLIHRPEHFEHYVNLGFDLVLCGHAHGGQWRIPGLLNGFYAPGQGLFPKFAGGLYEENGTTMIVSRGLAKESTFIPRIFNNPEFIVIDIT